MKKYLFLLLASIVLFSCNKVKIEGNIKGGTPLDRIEIIEASGVATLPLVNMGLDEKGHFEGEFDAPRNGMYVLSYGGLMNFVYLKKGQKLNISGNTNTFPQQFVIEGDAKNDNLFIKATQQYLESYASKLDMQFLQQNESQFLKEIEKIKSDLKKNIDDNAKKYGADSDVIKYKNDELIANILTFLAQYKTVHGQLIGDPTFKVSKKFVDYENTLTKYNDRLVEDLPIYRNYLLNKVGEDFQEYAMKQNDKDTVSMSTLFARYLKTNNEFSQKTKDYLLAFVIAKFDLNPYTTEVSKIKKLVDEETEDTKVKKDIKKAINAVFGIDNGLQAPDAKLIKLDGSTTSLADFKGKPTVVMTYASWNTDIGGAMVPVLKEVTDFYKSKANFVFVNLDDNQDLFKKTANSLFKGLPGVSLYADKGLLSDFAKSYYIYSFKIPGFFIIDKDGKIASRTFFNLGESQFIDTMTKLTGMQPPKANPNITLQNELFKLNSNNSDSAQTK